MCDICYFPAQTWCKTESQQPHDHSIGKAPWKHWDIGIPVFLFRASDRCLSASLMVLGSSCWRIGCIFAYVFPLCVVFCRFRPLSRIHARISIVSSLKEPWERTDSGHSPKKLAFQKLKRRRCYKTGRFLWLMFHNVFFVFQWLIRETFLFFTIILPGASNVYFCGRGRQEGHYWRNCMPGVIYPKAHVLVLGCMFVNVSMADADRAQQCPLDGMATSVCFESANGKGGEGRLMSNKIKHWSAKHHTIYVRLHWWPLASRTTWLSQRIWRNLSHFYCSLLKACHLGTCWGLGVNGGQPPPTSCFQAHCKLAPDIECQASTCIVYCCSSDWSPAQEERLNTAEAQRFYHFDFQGLRTKFN